MTIVRKEALRNTETKETGDNSENRKNKDEDSRTNLA